MAEVTKRDLHVLPYHIGKSRLSQPWGCPSELDSGMTPVVVARMSRGSGGWHGVIAMLYSLVRRGGPAEGHLLW
jgi:hypothetical protein